MFDKGVFHGIKMKNKIVITRSLDYARDDVYVIIILTDIKKCKFLRVFFGGGLMVNYE